MAPGPAGPAGVPADRVREIEAELAGVFAALEPAVSAARQVREEASVDAARTGHQAMTEAEQIVADARGGLAAVRADAASAPLAVLDDERAALEKDARAEVERVRKVSDARLPALVESVVADVWATGGVSTATSADHPGEVAR